MSRPAPQLSPSVLIIDDEPQIRRLLRVTLEGNGYRLSEAATGNAGLLEAAQRPADLVLLDLGLPDLDGLTVLKRLREWSHVPVIILSVNDRDNEKIEALDSGADDYVTKPFSTGELLARMRAALRHRDGKGADAIIVIGNLEVDLAARVVRKSRREVKLTPIEYALLRLFVLHLGKVLTHRQILAEVWGPKSGEQTHYLRVHIAHLREKIEDDPSSPAHILTEPGIGYRFVERECR